MVVEDRELVGRDVQGVVNQRKERDLQAVNLLQRDTTNLRVVLVTVVKVVKVLRGDHHACDQNSVNVVGIHDNVGVSDQAVDVDEGVDERLSATLGVLADSLHIIIDGDGGGPLGVELGDRADTSGVIVFGNYMGEDAGQHVNG